MGTDRSGSGRRPRRRRAPRAPTDSPGLDRAGGLDQAQAGGSAGSPEDPSGRTPAAMTNLPQGAPPPPSDLAHLLTGRDPSLPLAAAALARIADAGGRAALGDLAVAYREEFLKLWAHTRGGAMPESGNLSVDDARANLGSSVLPRLALAGVLTLPAGPLLHDAQVAFQREVWPHVAADRAGAIDQLTRAAEETFEHAES